MERRSSRGVRPAPALRISCTKRPASPSTVLFQHYAPWFDEQDIGEQILDLFDLVGRHENRARLSKYR